MYKLSYFSATNLIGFLSGLGRHKVTIDLEDFLDKEILIVCGANASGKSTFLSLVHPSPYPTNGKRKFVIKGKEGLLVRKYTSTDGTVITTKCVYKPKRDGGHNASCFFEIKKRGEEPIELNPTGNVTSYEELLYTYFGVTKDFLSFASFNNDVANIVKMTDTERKNSIGTLVPNTSRFEVGYNIVNDKYRDLRNLVRNLSQQILTLRDEDAMESDMKRLSTELRRYTEEREERIRELGTLEGQLKQLTKGEDIDSLTAKYDSAVALEISQGINADRTYHNLMKLYKKLGITPLKEGSINFDGIDQVASNIMKYDRKALNCEDRLNSYDQHKKELQKQLVDTEREIAELESSLYSIQTEDIGELKKTRKEYEDRLAEMRYSANKGQYDGMSYEEIINFSRYIGPINTMIQALYDEYGQLVTEYFESSSWEDFNIRQREQIDHLTVSLQTTSRKKDEIYQKLIENQQYARMGEVLKLRPISCTIDTCPFIAEALKWRNVADDITMLQEQYAASMLQIDEDSDRLSRMQRSLGIHSDAQNLIRYIQSSFPLIQKYLGVKDIRDIYIAIAKGTWESIFDIMKLKDLAAILSEKDLYLEITMQRIPELDHAIELAQVYGTNRDLLNSQLDRAREMRKMILSNLDVHDMHHFVYQEQIGRYRELYRLWSDVDANIKMYQEIVTSQLGAHEQAAEQEGLIKQIKEIDQKCRKLDATIRELDDLIRDRMPVRERLKLDLDAVRRLKIQKLEVERHFTVIDVVRAIMSPGKGIRKELINLYMYEIYQIANQLLLNTFDGKLYLKEFLITDKEFIIPYVYNGTESPDISFASSAQQAIISSAISLAILSKLVDKYGIYTPDELESPLNPAMKDGYINILVKQMHYVGITQAIMITQHPKHYEPYNVGYICFPGAELDSKNLDFIEI
ncbi:MAG: hypothetical protein NC114_06595 [Ruminococcus flavefaciens]|nr:hypothetical protein [Ruminococcus flavefaciens]